MGFFSDLKEDLSQAVNELMPEETPEMPAAEHTVAQDMPLDELLTNEASVADEPSEAAGSVDLSNILDQMEGANATGEPLKEAEISSDNTAELTEDTGMIKESEVTEEAREVLEPETQAEAGLYEDNILSGMDGEEEKIMDEQAQVQTQALANRVAVDETAIVTEGMTITGDIVSEGSMELIGTVNGNLDILGKLNITGNIQGDSKAAEIFAEGAKITGEVHSQGSVKIGQSSVVIGNIFATSAVVAGAVKGDIDVHGPVILDTTAIVMGNIKSKSVQINNGAVIEGLCSQCYADINPSSFFEEFKKKKA